MLTRALFGHRLATRLSTRVGQSSSVCINRPSISQSHCVYLAHHTNSSFLTTHKDSNISETAGFVGASLRSRMSTSQSESAPLNVKHDVDKSTFFIEMEQEGDGASQRAILEYAWAEDGLLDLYHTEVPVIFRGKGVAKLLAKAALEYGVSSDAKIKLTCTYLQKYVNDNPRPEYISRIV